MQIPDTPMEEDGSPATFLSSSALFESRPHIMIQGSNIAVNPHKRQKISSASWSFGSSTQRIDVKRSPQRDISPRSGRSHSDSRLHCSIQHSSLETSQLPSSPELSKSRSNTHRSSLHEGADMDPTMTTTTIKPSLRQSRIRDLIPVVIHEALRIGGRPDSSVGQPTLLGERIEVRTRSSNGQASYQVIEWFVQANVPEVLLIDERDISKLISCVFLNAVKFTGNGTISLVVSLSKSLRSVRINIIDSGVGIPKDFLPELFKPFSREDDSLTRSREGLGLGLLVAKGLARKLGGDLNLVRTETSGQRQGSEFEIKLPIGGLGAGSKPGTPFDRTPTPSSCSPPPPRSDSLYAATSHPKAALDTPTQASPQPQSIMQLPTTPYEMDLLSSSSPRGSSATSSKTLSLDRSAFDRRLAEKHPLTFLVAEDNKINRKLLVSMLSKLGYEDIYEAYDGSEAVQVMKEIAALQVDSHHHERHPKARRLLKPVDIILMDLWMPEMDGYEATERILDIFKSASALGGRTRCMAPPTVLAVSADVTDKAISRATAVGMEGFMTKPYKLVDLQRLVEEVCNRREVGGDSP